MVFAKYNEFGKAYTLKLDSTYYSNRIGQSVEVIYELSHPEKAAINKAWGYWFVGKEIGWAFGVFAVLLGIAFATTNKPHPDALAEQLSFKETIKTKYE